MLSNLLLIVLMIGGAFAAPWKAGIDIGTASSQISQGAANQPLSDSSTVSTTLDLNKTTSRSPGVVFSSLTSIFPISLPPDTLNSTLLPPPLTSPSASESLPASVSAPTSSEFAPTSISFSILPTISIPTQSTPAPAVASAAAASTTPPVATSPRPGQGTLTTRTSISILTITETETRTFFATHSRNISHTNPPFTILGGSGPTTLQISAKVNPSSISSASGPQETGRPCLIDPSQWCLPGLNSSQGSDNSSRISQTSSNNFRVNVTVNGGEFKGGKPFNSSGTYHGNCTNGMLDNRMASMDVHEPCGRDLMCLAGILMASLGSVVTEIMNPTPKGKVPIWCSNGMGGTNRSTKLSGSGSGMPWSLSETWKWNTSMASRTMIRPPGALSNTQIQPTHTPGVPNSPPTMAESMNSGYRPSIAQRQIITTTVSNSYTTATYDYYELSPFTWSENSVQVSEARTMLSKGPSITQRQIITTTVSNSYTTATYDYYELSPFTWSESSVQVSEARTMLSKGTSTPTNTA